MSPHLLSSQSVPCPEVLDSPKKSEIAEEALLDLISPYFDVKKTIYGGRGCFARSDIAKGTVLHVSRKSVGSSVSRVFRKEVCTGCFAYYDGKTLKHRLRDKIYFCSGECMDKFVKNDPKGLLTSTLVRVETLFAQSRGEVDEDSIPETEEDVSSIWADIEKWDSQFERLKPSKRANIRPVVNDDDYCELRYVISVLHTLHQVETTPKSLLDQLGRARLEQIYLKDMDETATMELESKLFHLLQSSEGQKVQRYPYLAVSYANIYKFIRLVAPPEYLPHLSIQSVRDIIGRNLTNAFGIWSPVDHPDEEREYFGFGVYPSASFFNHSCRPNVSKARHGEMYEYVASEDIAQGTELCISYGIRASDTVCQRRAALAEWFFTCGCLRCVTEAGEV